MADARFGLQHLFGGAGGLEGEGSLVHAGGYFEQAFGALDH